MSDLQSVHAAASLPQPRPPAPTACPKCGYVQSTTRCTNCGTDKMHFAQRDAIDARQSMAASSPQQAALMRHFDWFDAHRISAKDPLFRRLADYRHALQLLDECGKVRRAAGTPGLNRKTAALLWERDFRCAQMKRLALGCHLSAVRRG